MIPPLVIGLGSPHGDDQAGWLVIDRLAELGYPPSRLHKAAHPADLLDDSSAEQELVICDACDGKAAGTIHHWQWPTDSLIHLRTVGTHDLSLPDVLELAARLGRPMSVELYGITGADWSPASWPGLPVESAAREVAELILRDYCQT